METPRTLHLKSAWKIAVLLFSAKQFLILDRVACCIPQCAGQLSFLAAWLDSMSGASKDSRTTLAARQCLLQSLRL